VERGEKAVTNRKTLEAMASALRVHPSELIGQPWTRQDVVSTEAHAGLTGIEIALERYELGADPEVQYGPGHKSRPTSTGWCGCTTILWTTRCRASWRQR
jgi:hypothetical protein